MLLRLTGSPEIEDVWSHPTESVEALRTLLREGATAYADPRRKNFYEIDNCTRVFYIHITPSAKVLLLAIWSKDLPEANLQESRNLAAASS